MSVEVDAVRRVNSVNIPSPFSDWLCVVVRAAPINGDGVPDAVGEGFGKIPEVAVCVVWLRPSVKLP